MYDFIIGISDSSNVFVSTGRPNIDGTGIDPPDCKTLDNGVFENFILADEPFAKALWITETCVLVNNNLMYW